MYFIDIDIDYRRVVDDLNAAVRSVEHAFRSPEYSMRVAAMAEAKKQLDRAVAALGRVDLSR